MKEQHTDERTNEEIENMFYRSKKKVHQNLLY